jgi:O-antigen/teichoic acid export membrane protein
LVRHRQSHADKGPSRVFRKMSALFEGDGYTARASRGSVLMALNFGGQNFLRLASNLLLTRLLFPEAFGLMALVQLVIAGASMVSDFGLRSAVVSDPRGNDPAFLNTAFTLQILRGFVLTIVILVLAGPMARFYDEPQLAEILMLSALIPLISGFNSTRIFSASRELMMGRLTILMLTSQSSGILAMIFLAWLMQSVWALAIGGMVTAIVLAILSHVILPGPPNRLRLEWAAARRLFGFGKYIFLATLSSFIIAQGDKAILGKYVSLDDLAIYNIGFFLASVLWLLSRNLNDQIVFPLYARKPPAESEENRRTLGKARFALTGVVMLGTGIIALIGVPLVTFLYDPRYEAAGPVLVLVALAVMPRLITQSYEKLPLAAGNSGRYALIMMCSAAAQLGLTLIGVQAYGLLGAILAPLLSWCLVYPLIVCVARTYKGWSPLHDLTYILVALGFAALTLWLWYDDLAPMLPWGASPNQRL